MAICASRYAIKTGNSLCSLLRHSEYKTALCKSGCDAHKTFETEKNDPIGFSFRTTTKTATDFREFRWGESNSARLLAPKYESNVNYIVNKLVAAMKGSFVVRRYQVQKRDIERTAGTTQDSGCEV